jgi:hypothetical protein
MTITMEHHNRQAVTQLYDSLTILLFLTQLNLLYPPNIMSLNDFEDTFALEMTYLYQTATLLKWYSHGIAFMLHMNYLCARTPLSFNFKSRIITLTSGS